MSLGEDLGLLSPIESSRFLLGDPYFGESDCY